MQDAAQDIAPLDPTIARRRLQPNRALLIDTVMRPTMVVVLGIHGQHTTEMSLAEDQDLVQALLSNRTNPAFRKRICVRCSNGRANARDVLRPEDRVEVQSELGVTIVEQETCRYTTILELRSQVTGLLCYPRTCRA